MFGSVTSRFAPCHVAELTRRILGNHGSSVLPQFIQRSLLVLLQIFNNGSLRVVVAAAINLARCHKITGQEGPSLVHVECRAERASMLLVPLLQVLVGLQAMKNFSKNGN